MDSLENTTVMQNNHGVTKKLVMQYYQNLNFDIGPSILHDPKILFLHDKKNLDNLSAYHWVLSEQDLHPEFLNIIAKIGLSVYLIEAFKTNPSNNTWPIHIDIVEETVLEDLPKLNWIFGNTHSPMIWYKEKNPQSKTHKKTPTGTDYLEFGIDELEEVDRTVISTTAIVQAAVPHTVINTSGKSRYCISVIFKKENKHLTFDELSKEFIAYAI